MGKGAKPIRETEPAYMVPVKDPPVLRRDLLEALREIILFMQGYEKFQRIQQEKTSIFNSLQEDLRELNQLFDGRMRQLFPKGHLRPLHEGDFSRLHDADVEVPERRQPERAERRTEPVRETPRRPEPRNELDELEAQLKQIESQLRKVQ